MKKNYKILHQRPIYKGRVVDLSVDRVRLPNGLEIEREIIRHGGSAVMIPMLDRHSIILVRQFRYAAGGYIWELPAGTCEPGESALHCAKRELEEEIGYAARKFKKISTFLPTPGVSTEEMTLYLCTELTKTASNLDDDELLRARLFSVSRVARMIDSGSIIDGKTILGFLVLKKLGF